jgi:hypothetical protein
LIVAGHNVLVIEMFTDEVVPGFGAFGNQLRVPGGTSHQNRPHFPTLKALQVVSAAQYPFTSGSNDNRREHQGWGFPDLQRMWDYRAKTFLVDETAVITQGQVQSWPIAVQSGEPDLKICLNWSEPAGNPGAGMQLINNLSLRVTSPSGIVYWGNNGLTSGVWSVAGGSEDTHNSIECVFVQNPQAGGWNVEVIATLVAADNHVETPQVDADYGLVVSGGTGTQLQFATTPRQNIRLLSHDASSHSCTRTGVCSVPRVSSRDPRQTQRRAVPRGRSRMARSRLLRQFIP